MNIFFSPNALPGSFCLLDESESHHAIHVLRMKKGETIEIFDGKGSLYKGIIVDANKKNVSVQINALLKKQTLNNQLHIAIAPTKQMERLEWFIEKSVEIGIQQITPVICQRSERKELKRERLEKLIISACKQSKNYFLPALNDTCKFTDFISFDLPAERSIAWCEEKSVHIKQRIQTGKPFICLIGPEGDFTQEEVASAKSHEFLPVTFGDSILRTETAGIFATAAYALCNKV